MREIHLDGNWMRTKAEMHDYLIAKLNLPYYYGRNLDSLWNILSKENEPMKIVITNPKAIALGYGEVLIEMFRDLEKSNPNYRLEVL